MQTVAFSFLFVLIGYVPLLYHVFGEFWHACLMLLGVVQNGRVLFLIDLKIHAE